MNVSTATVTVSLVLAIGCTHPAAVEDGGGRCCCCGGGGGGGD